MKNRWMLTPIVLGILAAGSYAIFVLVAPPEVPEGVLYANGRIEGTEIRVSAEVSGRVLENRLEEGAPVAAGDLLVRLESADYAARLEQAEASVEAVEQELISLQQELKTAEHHLKTATDNLARLRSLRNEDIVTEQQLETAEDRFEEAAGAVKSLNARVDQMKARREAARHEADYLQQQLSKTTVHAPANGTVLVKAIEQGEFVMPGQPVAVLVDLSRLELTAYVPESDLAKVSLGDPVRIRVDAFPERYFDGSVSRIEQHAQFTPKDVHMPRERARLVFGVIVALDNPEDHLKPGMPADAWILWKESISWPEYLPVPGA